MDVFNIFCKYFRLPEGMANVSKYPILCTALLDDGSWSEEDLGELASNNLIGVFSEVVHIQDILVDNQPKWIPSDDLTPEEKACTAHKTTKTKKINKKIDH